MSGRTRAVGALIASFAVLVAAAAPAAADTVLGAPVQAYGTNDAGGFRNVLPPGENGVDNALQLGQFMLTGQRPPHFDDQLHLYTDLLYASPTLTHPQIANYYKDATFGVPPGDVASTENPQPGVTIVRDRSYGIPHVYGQSRADTMYGAGYAGAEDRLFLMDILRHTGRAQLSSFAGGRAGNRAMDHAQWLLAPYTEQDLQSQIDNAPRLYGDAGRRLIDDVNAYVAGINGYVDAALLDPTKLPAEYAAIVRLPTHWTPTDVVAIASLIGGIFGKGGGSELRSALTFQSFQRRLGAQAGIASWSDFRSKNDPEAPTTLAQPFPYEMGAPLSPRGLAMPDPGSVGSARVGAAVADSTRGPQTATPAPIGIPRDGSLGAGLLRSLLGHSPLASNWELVSARRSATGHPIAVMGPQVGYYIPQILLEEDLHGPGIDARGAAFPGVNLYVQLGHGRDYAWSATTATSDNVDTFAEVLCQDAYHYMYRSQCLPMERLDRTNTWTPSVNDATPPGSETLTSWRTAHGIVVARGTVNGGTPVAFTSARTTYFHEADSALGFSELNDPGFTTGPGQFLKAASDINFGFNWAYVDAAHIAYFHSGLYPQRAAGTSPDFPILGTGEYDWQGYDPALHTLAGLPPNQHPQALDPEYLLSWNNKQAPQWSAADDKYGFSSVYRSQMIEAGIKRALAGGGRMRVEQLVSAMDEAATTDVRAFALWPTLRRVLGTPSEPALRAAIGELDAWYADGGHRRDLNNRDISKPGTDQHTHAIEIMDAWWPLLLRAEFRPILGAEAFGALTGMIPIGGIGVGQPPGDYPSFSDGWYGYVSKDLRDLLASAPASATAPATNRPCTGSVAKRRACVRRRRRLQQRERANARHHRRHHRARTGQPAVAGAYSRVYCGNGSLDACRTALRETLGAALATTPSQIYGNGACASDPQPSCYDMDRSTVASGIKIPPFPFQNRPTFQQVVELTQTLPR